MSKSLYVSAAMCALIGTSGTGVNSNYKVTVQDNGQRRIVRGYESETVETLLEEQHIAFSQSDRIRPGLLTPIKNGMTVVVDAPKTIQLVDGTAAVRLDTFARTVGDLLKQQKIALGPLDQISKPLGSALEDGETLRISRRHTNILTSVKEIPFQTIRRQTDELYVGQKRILTYGVKGSVRVKSVQYFVNGRCVRQQIVTELMKKPVDQVIEVGSKTRTPLTASRSGGVGNLSLNPITVVATAYTGGGRTATGWVAGPGVIAVDPSVIPLGTKLYIPGIGVVYAEDTGGAINGNRIDICMNSEAEALKWGVRTITIYEIK